MYSVYNNIQQEVGFYYLSRKSAISIWSSLLFAKSLLTIIGCKISTTIKT